MISALSIHTHFSVHIPVCATTRYWILCSFRRIFHCNWPFFHRPNTGIQVWMRWRELSQIKRGRSSTNSLESGTKQFSVETLLQRHASGEQVWQVSWLRTHQKLICKSLCYVYESVHWILFVWITDAIPVNHEQYYGFTKFAIELNELDSSLKLLPPTDTRLRVDQR